MASLPGSRTAGFIASLPAVSKPCGLPFASVVSTFPAPSGKPKLHETSPLMSIPGEELHMPLVAKSGQPSADVVGEFLAEPQPLLPDRLVTDFDAPESEHLLNHPKSQGKPEVQPDRVADQLRRKAMPSVGRLGRSRHGCLIAGSHLSGMRWPPEFGQPTEVS